MKSVKKFIKCLLTDERGSVSSKRIVGLTCAFVLCGSLVVNQVNGTTASDILVTSVTALGFGCLGLTTIDKFTLKK